MKPFLHEMSCEGLTELSICDILPGPVGSRLLVKKGLTTNQFEGAVPQVSNDSRPMHVWATGQPATVDSGLVGTRERPWFSRIQLRMNPG